MNDFDAVLERLLADPGFKAALAADPAAALAGYTLAPDELELLYSQLSTDSGGERAVEQRTSKAGLFGMLQPLADAAGFGHAADGALPGGQGGGTAGFSPVGQSGHGGFSEAPPPDYHANVDADGDGQWDQYTVQSRSGGGVDVFVDTDNDGRADFVGHDSDSDGLIDSADYDANHDGVFETHLADVNGDGWMDAETVDAQPETGSAPAVGVNQRFGTQG